MNDQSTSQIAPSGTFFNNSNIPCSNPFLSDQQFDVICGQQGLTVDDVSETLVGRRNVEGGNRQNEIEYNTFRGVFGLRGDINDTWRYDGYFMYARVDYSDNYQNDLNINNIQRALDAVEDPETGEIVCASALDGIDPTVCPTMFSRPALSPRNRRITSPFPCYGMATRSRPSALFTVEGNLGDYGIKLPWANDGIAVVIGAEYRKESLELHPRPGLPAGPGCRPGWRYTGDQRQLQG